VVEVNNKLTFEAEIINQSPYDDGWLAIVKPSAWEVEKAGLMSPQAYYERNQAQALEEISKK
jgi:glycine cleavage system H lipoate-binding protein